MRLQIRSRVGSLDSGFALVATVSLLLLLTVVAVAFLSLSSLSVRSARTDWAHEEARANARLALMVAIGELQRELGPDQRVSATAEVFDEEPETAEIDGVEEPKWVGVWDTRMEEEGSPEETTTWVRDDERGGLRDRIVRKR